MKRVGVFGGSFNPIHIGHTALAASICDLGIVDEVWLMVSPQNPLKRNLELLDEKERLEMARLATAPYPMLHACDFEFSLPRPSYTYHTLQALRKAYPDIEFSLIIGEDNWEHFDRWYRSEDILQETPIIVYPRSDSEKSSEEHIPNSDNSRLSDKMHHKTQPKAFVDSPLLPYSSTEIRNLIAREESVSHMLHPAVEKYIKNNGFYTKTTEQ